jgi:type IV pilus assembly protein PilA
LWSSTCHFSLGKLLLKGTNFGDIGVLVEGMVLEVLLEYGFREGLTMRRENGFTLVELLLVVAVILIIVAIAIPSLIRARISANESSAVQSLRQIATAEVSYQASYSSVGYAPNLASLGGPAVGCTPGPFSACILDPGVSSGAKSGYQLFAAGFAIGATPINTQFVASAAPQVYNQTGSRRFCIATSDGSARMQVGPGAIAMDVPTCLAYPIM